ncbi:MAG: hypothetical protein HFE63_05265 [Clostridiales bacterium]|nr:hypothetical protein [Clostridiales bacterium]
MYDQTYPDRLIAQAEIRFVNCTQWINYDGFYLTAEELEELGINTIDSYGYTKAILYDYWQTDE